MIDNRKIYYQRLKTTEEKFWEKVEKGSPDDCWIWTGSTRNGYGRMYDGELKKNVSAHRMAWKIRFGEYPDENEKVLHKCDNPSCVNFNHFFLGTQQDNMDDMISKGRHRYPTGSKVHTNRLSEDDVRKIRVAHKTTKNGIIAKEFGVSESTIKHIVRGRSWAWLK